ncbi:unnamed protein product [Acanthoscelides obtectus]|uniref:Uncharacterized protein n=1 Tax=Acanthoscelides obtectus TaxID=200917 RepID=A0A9P0KIW1_ACAOB|nr:unnamed protein product [Acanthoscelides obtectus]CAK1656904.1 hypothetical protein AOBTE_LOCUS20011 [Acanthoscelides obtectus]
MEAGFVKGLSDNSPNIDIYAVMKFISSNPSYTSAEIKGVKLWELMKTICCCLRIPGEDKKWPVGTTSKVYRILIVWSPSGQTRGVLNGSFSLRS